MRTKQVYRLRLQSQSPDAARVGGLFNLAAIRHRIIDALADLNVPLDIAFLPTMPSVIRPAHDDTCLQVIG